MNKTLISTAIAAAIGSASFSANAAITTSSVLAFTDGIGSCVLSGTYPTCKQGLKTVAGGTWFSMDTDGNGSTALTEKFPIQNSGTGTASTHGIGIHIGDLVDGVATGSHSGPINGTESPAFDIWEFFGGTGMNYLTSAITVVDNAVGGNPNVKALDLSGWTVTWNGIAGIGMGGDAVNFGTTGNAGDVNSGLALLTCSTASCSASSTFTLSYKAQVPKGDSSMFGGVGYELNMVGSIGTAAVVPVPTAVWLFGSGLLGLVGVARRKATQA